MAYIAKTEVELEHLAWDAIGGKIFGSWQIQNQEQISICFMVLLFLPEEDLKQMQKDNICHFYEYMEKASPRAINGMPCFMSAHYLDETDSEKLRIKVQEV